MQDIQEVFQIPQAFISISGMIQSLSLENVLEHNPKIDKNLLDVNYDLPIYFHSKDIEDHVKNPTHKIDFIYIARKGQKFDGHTLAAKILNSGNIFIGETERVKQIYTTKSAEVLQHNLFIPVKNSEQALNCILENAFKINSKNFFTIAVTGTNGKTSVTQLTANLLSELGNESVLKIGTLGVQVGNVTLPVSHVTTPDYPSFLSILSAAQYHNIKKMVIEYTSHGLKEKRLGDWLADIAIFTNLTQDHLDYHKTMADYRSSKQMLFSTYLAPSGTAIININNDEWMNFVNAAKGAEKNLVIVGKKEFHSEIEHKFRKNFASITYIHIESFLSNLKGISGTLIVKNNSLKITEQCGFSCPLIGEFQFENILCAAGVGVALKFSLEKICLAFQTIKNIPGRLEKIPIPSKKLTPTVLVDYAHTPDALEKSILTCKKTLPSQGKLITVFGCGGDRDPTKRPLMGDIAFTHSDLVVVTSDNPRTEDPNKIIDDIFHGIGINEKWMRESDRKKAIQNAIALASENDIVLVAGKGHEDYQIIGTTKYPFSDAAVIKSILENI